MTDKELDAVVAEHVMGWIWRTRIDGKTDFYTKLLPPDFEHITRLQIADRE